MKIANIIVATLLFSIGAKADFTNQNMALNTKIRELTTEYLKLAKEKGSDQSKHVSAEDKTARARCQGKAFGSQACFEDLTKWEAALQTKVSQLKFSRRGTFNRQAGQASGLEPDVVILPTPKEQ